VWQQGRGDPALSLPSWLEINFLQVDFMMITFLVVPDGFCHVGGFVLGVGSFATFMK
jgi:hypothetical protein